MEPGGTTPAPLRVLRVYHSAVVNNWRARERHLNELGCEVHLISSLQWNEGGKVVRLTDAEPWVTPTSTAGRHPYRFVYNPLPIIRVLRRHRFDVIDIHEEPASLAAFEVAVLARLFGHRHTPVVLYSAQNIEKRYPPPFRWIERWMLRRIAALYPCNTQAGDIAVGKGLRGSVHVLPLGVEIDQPPQPRSHHSDQFIIGYVGRLEEHKGVAVVLQAMRLLPPNVQLVVVGDGSQRGALMHQANGLGIEDRVQFIGHLSQHDVVHRYPTFDLLVVPSQTRPNWVEQFGRVAAEAMATGVPVVASNSGSLPDVVGDAGLLVPEDDPRAWATAIHDLAQHEDLRKDLARRAAARAATFTWASIAEQQLAMYRGVLR